MLKLYKLVLVLLNGLFSSVHLYSIYICFLQNNFYKDSEEIHADVCDKIKRLYPSLFNAKQQKNAKRDDAANSSDDEIADNIKSKLAEIKALSITVDDNR